MIFRFINRKTFLVTGFSLFAFGMSAACTPQTATRGNLLDETRTGQIKIGTSNREDVFRALGSPTTVSPFDSRTWYYMGQKTEKHGIFDTEVVDEKIVVVQFDEQNIVQKFESMSDARLNVPIKDSKTPTYGNEITAVQQLLGNLGKFNPQEQGE